MHTFILFILSILLLSCANTPFTVYQDSKNIEVKSPKTVKVWGVTPSVLSTLSYPMGIRHTKLGYNSVSTLNPIYGFRTVLNQYKYIKYSKEGSDYTEYLQNQTKSNANLDAEDISLFEFKIIGLKSGKVTTVNKRFSGPVNRFNWIKLFENKVPVDRSGYLLTGTAYVNYIPIFELPSNDHSPPEIDKEDKKYLIAVPIQFSIEPEYKAKYYEGSIQSENPDCIYGKHPQVPMALVNYSQTYNKKTGTDYFSSASNFKKSVKVDYKSKWCESTNKTAKDIFKKKTIRVGNSFYSNAYLLNSRFVGRNNLLKTNFSKRKIKRKKIRELAMTLTYKDDPALHKINSTMSDARSGLGQLSQICQGSIEGMNRLSTALSSFKSSHRRNSYLKKFNNFSNLTKRLNYFEAGIRSSTKRFQELVASKNGIQASIGPLRTYNYEASIIPKNLHSAKQHCAQLYNAISALGGGSSASSAGFLDALGSAIQEDYSRAVKAKAGYSPSTKPAPGSAASLNTMWSGFQKTNTDSMIAIRSLQLNKKNNSLKYRESIKKARENYRLQELNSASKGSHLSNNAQASDPETKCITSGGIYNKKTRHCIITKNINTAVVTRLEPNRVGHHNRITKKSESVESSNKPSGCSEIPPTSSTHALPIISAEGKGLKAINSMSAQVNEYMKKQCGEHNYRINGSSIPRSTNLVLKKAKFSINNLERATTKSGQTFSCGCNFTGEKSRINSGEGVSK